MNPNTLISISPIDLARSLRANRNLILQMIKREIAARYKGSVMGFTWNIITPMLLLAVYTFVFSVIFKARWTGSSTDSRTEFALILFSGLMIFNLFSECVTKAPHLVVANPNYVKKVVFPLEILPYVSLGVSGFSWTINLVVWLIYHFIFLGIPPVTIFLLPLVMLPVVFLSLGMSWLLAALGVYLRDIAHLVSIAVTVLLFMTPVFYPIAAVPEPYRHFMMLSPMTISIESARLLMFNGRFPSLTQFLWSCSTAFGFMLLSFTFFQKSKRGFADVV